MIGAEPLKVVPDAAPEPLLLTVRAFATDPAAPLMAPMITEPGIVLEAVTADVPLPNRYPDRVVAPVPPLATFKVPARVTAPPVAVEGVKPVVPALKLATPVLIVDQLVLPLPSVVKYWPEDPALVGSVNVQVPVAGAVTLTVLDPAPIKPNDPVSPHKPVLLFQVNLDDPANEPEELY